MKTDSAEEGAPHLGLVVPVILLVITLGAAFDLLMDRPEQILTFHVLFEISLALVSLGAASWLTWGWYHTQRRVNALRHTADERRDERDAWRARAGRLLDGLAQAMDGQFQEWSLTPAERETAFMLLKGYSHKRIGRLTNRSERTVRQHAVAVYRKAKVANRSELSAFFLEDLFLPLGDTGGATDVEST